MIVASRSITELSSKRKIATTRSKNRFQTHVRWTFFRVLAE